MNITVHYNFLQLPNIITTLQKLKCVANFTEKTFTPQKFYYPLFAELLTVCISETWALFKFFELESGHLLNFHHFQQGTYFKLGA